MNILFVHGNYPAQFVHIAQSLANSGHQVIYLTQKKNPEVWPIKGVEVRRFDCHRQPSPQTHQYLTSTEHSVLRGQAVTREIARLIKEGFTPNLIFFHVGNGFGLFLRQLVPHTLVVGYTEWWFHDQQSRCLFDDYSFDRRLLVSMRNGVVLQELEVCDRCVTPTQWQWEQFPAAYRSKIDVVFDGVDTNLFQPRMITSDLLLAGDALEEPLCIPQDAIVLSYATRGMEPLRGFPEFMRMLPLLLERFPGLQVVIAGIDRAAYSFKAPDCDGSWKKYMLAELEDFPGLDRVHFTGSLVYRDYQLLLCRSDLHVYFTRPYVTSWGLFQAAASGAHLMVNRDPATTYVLKEHQALWVDLDDQDALAQSAAEWLVGAKARRQTQRQSLLLPEWELKSCLSSWRDLLNELVVSAASSRQSAPSSEIN